MFNVQCIHFLILLSPSLSHNSTIKLLVTERNVTMVILLLASCDTIKSESNIWAEAEKKVRRMFLKEVMTVFSCVITLVWAKKVRRKFVWCSRLIAMNPIMRVEWMNAFILSHKCCPFVINLAALCWLNLNLIINDSEAKQVTQGIRSREKWNVRGADYKADTRLIRGVLQ